MLSSAYQSFATDTKKDRIIQNLQETEDWLHEDSDDESDEQVYTGKLEDLKRCCFKGRNETGDDENLDMNAGFGDDVIDTGVDSGLNDDKVSPGIDNVDMGTGANLNEEIGLDTTASVLMIL
ncbi:heat shock 70 kDa protein 16-like protein [Tanacetum coccineum]